MTELQEIFLQLVRLGIGTGTAQGERVTVNSSIDWQALKVLADEQGLSAVVLDGLNTVQSVMVQGSMPQMMRLEWIGEVLQNYEQRYKQYEKATGSLAGWYNQHEYKMMVLKGYACSLDWPKPEHRPCGDIDIWLFGQQVAADKALGSWFKVHGSRSEIDTSHHHHTVFEWEGFTVENHYDFINVHHHKSHVALEKVLKELGADDLHYVEEKDASTTSTNSATGTAVKVYIPSPNLHALFLLKHAALHFVGTELTFRQILDWAFFVQKHGKDVDWKMLLPIIEEHGMTPFLNILNAICVGELGFDACIFPTVQFNSELKDRVVNEVFSSVYDGDREPNVFARNIKRFQRWKGNAWKHELCYKESMWSAFWSGVEGHLLKPCSI